VLVQYNKQAKVTIRYFARNDKDASLTQDFIQTIGNWPDLLIGNLVMLRAGYIKLTTSHKPLSNLSWSIMLHSWVHFDQKSFRWW